VNPQQAVIQAPQFRAFHKASSQSEIQISRSTPSKDAENLSRASIAWLAVSKRSTSLSFRKAYLSAPFEPQVRRLRSAGALEDDLRSELQAAPSDPVGNDVAGKGVAAVGVERSAAELGYTV
jgi:hypothetical protein